MMNQLLPEIISHILRFLNLSDRKEAALVCKKWYNASLDPRLQKDIIMKCHPLQGKRYMPSQFMGRKITHLVLGGDTMSSNINEDNLVTALSQCPSLIGLDLSGCNSIFLSGRLLSNEKDRLQLQKTLVNVQELKLARLRHMTDISFSRLVSVIGNLSSISLASNNIIFSSTNSYSTIHSPAVFQFSTFITFIHERVDRIRMVDLSHTSVNDHALEKLAQVPNLCLDEVVLCGCMELSDKGIKFLSQTQGHLKKLNLSGCKELGTSKAFFKTLVHNLEELHTLKLRKCPRIGQCDIVSLSHLSSLQVLDLGEALNLYDTHLIKGLCRSNIRLSSVHLAYCPDICDAFVSSLCKSSPGLRHLDLTACNRITDASVRAISQSLFSLQSLRLAYCHRLTDLGLLGCLPENGTFHHHSFEFDHDSCCCTRDKESTIFRKPTGILKDHKTAIDKAQSQLDSGETMYKLSNLTGLQTLDLSSCSRLTDMGITETIQFKNMRSLSISNLPKLTDKSVQHIVRTNPSLEDVALRGCPEITDLALKALATHSPCLSSLDVSQNNKLTDEYISMLTSKCRRLKHLDISFCGNVSVDTVMTLESKCQRVKFHFRPHIYI